MEAISDLPMLHDIDADYSPQYVKLARILRAKIESGQHKRGDALPAADLAQRVRGIRAGRMARAGDARRQPVRPAARQVRPLHRDLAGGFVMHARRRRTARSPGPGCSHRRKHPRPAPAQWMDPGRARRAHAGGRQQRGFAPDGAQQLAAIRRRSPLHPMDALCQRS